ncbi:hypothetical protein [Sphingomonas sp. LHG3406-1]|uniref:hypothetical protein n=1 Tax=Sphingomonas sp. LHG3406-1 TaxID=2804617 RepID=UPI00261A916B|nr:hypothetical protein [Sphingomonas sp. LHG3406-1]
MFWDQEEPPPERTLVTLRGQACTNRHFGALDWSATYRVDRQDEVLLRPPGATTSPVILVRQDGR